MTIRNAALIGLLALLSVPAVAHAREAPEGARDQQVTLYELVLRHLPDAWIEDPHVGIAEIDAVNTAVNDTAGRPSIDTVTFVN